jgi:DNA-binding NtrC family response regulator
MSSGSYEGLRVLVVDDEPIVCRNLERTLRKLGFEITTSVDPAIALEEARRRPFDIVVTDIVMGEVDGIQVLEAVREASPRTRVIIITAFATRDKAREALAKGAFDFIAKPFDASEIRALVTRAADELRDESSDA